MGLTGCPGTPEYLSPEVIQSKGHTKAVDWWALGILIYEMVLGYPPFYDNSPIQIYRKIVAEPVDFPAWVPPDTRDIVQRLCTKDLSARLGNTKAGGAEVMRHPVFSGINWRELESQKYEVCVAAPVCPGQLKVERARWCRSYVSRATPATLKTTIRRARVRTTSTPKACIASMTMSFEISDF